MAKSQVSMFSRPTPWKADPWGDGNSNVVAANDLIVCVDVTDKIANQIVESANSHATLTARNAELESEVERLREALSDLLSLNDNHSPFLGEIGRDRIDRAWDAARSALSPGAKGEAL